MEMPRPPSKGRENKLDIVKFKDGDSVTGICIGKFHTYHALFNGKYFQLVDENTPGAKFRFRITFAVKYGANWTLKVIEQGAMLFEKLYDLNKDYPLDATVITVKRKGSSATDTEYSALPTSKKNGGELTKEDAAYLATLKPLDLRLDEEMEMDKFNEI